MSTDNVQFPPRFIGYGAYNLCFDTKLAPSTMGGVTRNFFEYIRSNTKYDPINLVKVICFRNSTLEGLPDPLYDPDPRKPEVQAGSRTQPLFQRNGQTNPHFLENLVNLATKASAKGFWVQVCIFHEQAVKANSKGEFETPENVPPELNTTTESDNCKRLTKFFTIDNATQEGRDRLARQKQLPYDIAFALRMQTKVLFEIGNEIRIDGCPQNNCAMVPWIQTIAESVLSGIFWDFAPSLTSTGTNNEHEIFDPVRPAGCTNVPKPWKPALYDFHSGQWGIPANDIYSDGYIQGIPAALNRAKGYMGGRMPRLIINDDGAKFGDEPSDSDKRDHAALIKKWAAAAYAAGCDYSSKQQYPPAAWDTFALDALVGAIPK